MAVGLTLGCEKPSPPVVPAPVTQVAVPREVSVPVSSSVIPRAALAYRGNFLRIWRFYFALAEPPAIGAGQVHQESRWNPNAQSAAGASGLSQFMPATAAGFAGILPPEVRATCPQVAGCPLDPNWALFAMSQYDYQLHRSYAWAATPRDRWAFVLVSYNGGARHILREQGLCESAVASSLQSGATAYFQAGVDGMSFSEEMIIFPESSVESIMHSLGYASQVQRRKVPRIFISMMYENLSSKFFTQYMLGNQSVDILRTAVYTGSRVSIQRKDLLPHEQTTGQQYLAQAEGKICDRNRWFDHVEKYCNRTPANCKENRGYPRVILDKWTPLYRQWLGV